MAKLNEEIIVIKISTVLPDTADMTDIMSNENLAALRQVVEELAGDNKTLVEIEKA